MSLNPENKYTFEPVTKKHIFKQILAGEPVHVWTHLLDDAGMQILVDNKIWVRNRTLNYNLRHEHDFMLVYPTHFIDSDSEGNERSFMLMPEGCHHTVCID